MEASEYALVHGMRCTRSALAAWRADPWPVFRGWALGALAAAGLLLAAVLAVSLIAPASAGVGPPGGPPFVAGGTGDLVHILVANGLVLALHAMACVAGFIAGSSLPLQAETTPAACGCCTSADRPSPSVSWFAPPPSR